MNNQPLRSAAIARSPVRFLASTIVAVVAAGSLTAQSSPSTIVGGWRADAPLPNGVVQTFRFGTDGKFELGKGLAVDGSYSIDGNRLIETVTVPSVGVAHTDTTTFSISGDSLMVNESAGGAARVLHRSATVASAPSSSTPSSSASSIVGDWQILVGKAMPAHYIFDAGGNLHVRAQVGDEQGSYTIRADTLRLSNNETFNPPAIAHFAITDSVLTLTPPSGKQARTFHKITPP